MTPVFNYETVDGFPSHFLDIFPLFGIQVIQPLDQIEQTLVFAQLLLHSRLGFPKDDLPEETKAKLMFY